MFKGFVSVFTRKGVVFGMTREGHISIIAIAGKKVA